jgi:hypothetical protein
MKFDAQLFFYAVILNFSYFQIIHALKDGNSPKTFALVLALFFRVFICSLKIYVKNSIKLPLWASLPKIFLNALSVLVSTNFTGASALPV